MSATFLTKALGRSMVSVGQYLNHLGGFLTPEHDRLQRTRRVNPFLGTQPTVTRPIFLAPSSTVIGDVTMEPACTVWYNAVIRGEKGPVKVGSCTHIQERTVIAASLVEEGVGVTIGSCVVIEAGVTVGPSTIEDEAYICSGAVITEGSVVPKGAVIGSGYVVEAGAQLTENTFYAVGEEPRAVTQEERVALTNKLMLLVRQARGHEALNTLPLEKELELIGVSSRAAQILADSYTNRPNLVVRSPLDLPGGRVQTMRP